MATALPPSAVALADILKEGGETAAAIKDRFDRTAIWHWLNGSRIPEMKSSKFLETVTDGRVPMNGWIVASDGAAA